MARALGREAKDESRTVAIARALLTVGFVLAGLNHFRDPDFYVAIMPPYVPWHAPLVYVSGVFEIALGVLVWPVRTRRIAGVGLIALLVAVFPANLHMALNEVVVNGAPAAPRWALWVRLPFQLVFIVWVYWVTLAGGGSSKKQHASE